MSFIGAQNQFFDRKPVLLFAISFLFLKKKEKDATTIGAKIYVFNFFTSLIILLTHTPTFIEIQPISFTTKNASFTTEYFSFTTSF
jgi:hypothetical protein